MTAVDTNVFAALGSPNPSANTAALTGLETARNAGTVCICGAVFAELLGFPGRDSNGLRRRFESFGISIEWGLGESDWETAGLAYRGYVARRRASAGGLPRLMLIDFLIGAHSLVRGYTLLTSDKRLYSAAFPALVIRTL